MPKEYPIQRHCFTGDLDEATEWLEAFPNLYLSFTCLIASTKNSQSLRNVAKVVPLDRFLIETDSPYFRPYCVSL